VAFISADHRNSFFLIRSPERKISIPLLTISPSRFTHTFPEGAGCAMVLSNKASTVVLLKRSIEPDNRKSKKAKSIPAFSVDEVSHFRSGFPKFVCCWLCIPNMYLFLDAPEGNSLLPVLPYPNRNLRLSMLLFCKNSSLAIFQAKASEGKFAYLLFSPNLVEPSLRIVPVSRYLF